MNQPPAYRSDGSQATGRRNLLIVTAVILLAAVVVVYSVFDPESPWMPHCLLKTLTGYDCPGCGSQRSLHALLHGHPVDAWHYNPAIFVLLPLLILYGLSEAGLLSSRRLESWLYHPLTHYLIAAGIVGWWIARNL